MVRISTGHMHWNWFSAALIDFFTGGAQTLSNLAMQWQSNRSGFHTNYQTKHDLCVLAPQSFSSDGENAIKKSVSPWAKGKTAILNRSGRYFHAHRKGTLTQRAAHAGLSCTNCGKQRVYHRKRSFPWQDWREDPQPIFALAGGLIPCPIQGSDGGDRI